MSEGQTTSATKQTGGQSAQVMRRQSTEAATNVPGGAGAAADLQAFLVSLLEQQSGLIGAAAGLVYLLGSSVRQAGIAAVYVVPGGVGPISASLKDGGGAPTGTNGHARPGSVAPAPDPAGESGAAMPGLDRAIVARMERIGAKAAAESRGVVEAVTLNAEDGLYHTEPTHRLIGCPLVAAEQVHGASVLLVPLSGPAARLPAAEGIERLKLTASRFEAYLWRQQCVGEAHAKTRLRETLELLDAAQQGGDAESMGALFCHELARRFGCTRVSVGLVWADRLRLKAVSGADDLDRRSAAAVALEAAMEECADQDAEIVYPQPPEVQADPALRRVTRAHEELSTRFGPAAILSLPLRVEGDLVGVVVLEREASDPFPPGAVPLMRLIAEFIGPAVWTRRMADRGVLAVARDRAVEIATLAVGPRYTGAKLLGLLALVTLLAMAVIPIPGRVLADVETRAAVSRVVSPPFTGYIASIEVRPGDEVAQGQLLATMEMEETAKQLAYMRSEAAKTRTQQADARNKGQQGDVEILAASLAALEHQIDLLLDRESRSRIVSPISGRVGRGDAELLVGAQADPNEPLFEVIGQEGPVVTFDVDERDIGRVRVGQEGWVSFSGEPGKRLPVRVARVRPVAEPVDGRNVYKVEAEMTEPQEWVRPGMTGTGRLRDGTTTALAWLMRPLMDRVRLYFWW